MRYCGKCSAGPSGMCGGDREHIRSEVILVVMERFLYG